VRNQFPRVALALVSGRHVPAALGHVLAQLVPTYADGCALALVSPAPGLASPRAPAPHIVALAARRLAAAVNPTHRHWCARASLPQLAHADSSDVLTYAHAQQTRVLCRIASELIFSMLCAVVAGLASRTARFNTRLLHFSTSFSSLPDPLPSLDKAVRVPTVWNIACMCLYG
jgi:hypothetical protein